MTTKLDNMEAENAFPGRPRPVKNGLLASRGEAGRNPGLPRRNQKAASLARLRSPASLALFASFAWLLAAALAFAPTASAATSPLGGGGGPISISADHMSADQNSRIVTFTGRVIARQDDLIITCDQMRVHYQPVNTPRTTESEDAEAIAAMEAGIPPLPPQNPDRVTVAEAGASPDQSPSEAPAEAPSPGSGQASQASGDPLGGGQEVYRVDCEGSVRVQQKDKLAVGQKALYLAKSEPRRLILTGEARIWEGANSVTGHQVVYYLDQNRSQVESRDKGRVRAFYDQGGEKSEGQGGQRK